MGADLVSFPGMESDLEEGSVPSLFHDLIFGYDLLAARLRKDFNARRIPVFFEIGDQRIVRFWHFSDHEGVVNFCDFSFPKKGEEFLLHGKRLCEEQQTGSISIEPMHGQESGSEEDGLRIHAALLIDEQQIFVLIEIGEGNFLLLRGGQEVLHAVPYFEGEVARDLCAVDFNFARFEERAKAEGGLRAMVIGEVFERTFFAYEKTFQLYFSPQEVMRRRE